MLLGSYPSLSLADARAEWRTAKAVRDRSGDQRNQWKARKDAEAERALQRRGYIVKQAAEDYNWEHLSKLARGSEQWHSGAQHSTCHRWRGPGGTETLAAPGGDRPDSQAGTAGCIHGSFGDPRADPARKGKGAARPGCPEPDGGRAGDTAGQTKRSLVDAEICTLLRWLDSGAVSKNITDILRLTLYTGARTGEVCAMRSRDVDIVSRTWTHTQTKTGT